MAMQHYRELAGHRHHRPLLGVLAPATGNFHAVSPQIRVSGERTQDVVGTSDQKSPYHLVALSGDAPLRITISRLILGRHEPQIRAYRAALLEPVRVLQGQHEGQGTQCSHSLYLPKE